MSAFETLRAHARLLAHRRPGLREGESIPRLEVGARSLRVTEEQLRRYCALTGFARGEALPLTAPQVFAAGLHVELLGDPAFPLPALGLVHLGNRIEQSQPVPARAPFEARCWVQGQREVPLGVEFDLHTEVRVEGAAAWRSVTSVLSRRKGARPEKREEKKPAEAPHGPWLRSTVLRVPESLGREYASVAGDLNPIHQHALAAKLFGFPRAIVHGMWTLARTVSEAESLLPAGPLVLEARFRKPVFLPGRVHLCAWREGDALLLRAEPEKGGTPHLEARCVGVLA